MWSSEKLACSMKHGLRFENNNYILKGKQRPTVKPCKEKTHKYGLWMYYLVPGIAALLCFCNSLQGEFVHDDIPAIANNKDVRGESSIQDIFTHDFWGKSMWDNTSHKSYRPLTVLSFR